jgi:hypothetical protein
MLERVFKSIPALEGAASEFAESQVNIKVVITEVDNRMLSQGVYKSHDADLTVPFLNIRLIDTYRIYPESSNLVIVSKVSKGMKQVCRNIERLSVNQNTPRSAWVSPNIGKSCIFIGYVVFANSKSRVDEAAADLR